MNVEVLGRIAKSATIDVFSTMLDLELSASDPEINAKPLRPSEITALVGLAAAEKGFVSLHCTRAQAQDFTARLLGSKPEEVSDSESIADALGEIANMVAGNVKREYVPIGTLELSLPTVFTKSDSGVHVSCSQSTVVRFDGSAGCFSVEIYLTEADA